MQSRGAREFARHFSSNRHWEQDVAYRVQNAVHTFNRQMAPLVLTSEQRSKYLNCGRVDKDEGFNFPEDMLPSFTCVESTVPLLTMVNCIAELFRCAGSYGLLWNCGATSGLPQDCSGIFTTCSGIVPKLWLVFLVGAF